MPDRSGGGPSSSACTRTAASPRSTSRRPVSMIRPARSIATRSHTASTSLRMCDDSSTVCPRSRASRTQAAEHLLHQRVEPGGRLVEQQQVGPAGERGDEQDLLPVAVAVGADLLVEHQLEPIDQLVAVGGVDRAVHVGQEPQRLGAGERRPQVRLARHVGEAPVDRRASRQTSRPKIRAPPDVGRIRPSSSAIVVDLPGAVRARGSRRPPPARSRGRASRARWCARIASSAARCGSSPSSELHQTPSRLRSSTAIASGRCDGQACRSGVPRAVSRPRRDRCCDAARARGAPWPLRG